jgi:hypothetical protein
MEATADVAAEVMAAAAASVPVTLSVDRFRPEKTRRARASVARISLVLSQSASVQ